MLNPRIKMRHAKTFLMVAHYHSFAKAAAVLAVTQPAVSKSIRELEDILETRLFDRSGNEVTLTPSGLALLRHVGPGMRTLSEGFRLATREANDVRKLRIGALSNVQTWLVPTAIKLWQQSLNRAQTELVAGPSAYLLSRLRQGDLDVVVGRMSDAKEIQDLGYEHLYYEPLILVVRSGHPLAGDDTPDLAEFTAFPWVIPPAKSTLRPKVDSFFVTHGVPQPAICLETSSLPVSRTYTRITDAIWVAPREAVYEDIQTGTLTELTIPFEGEGASVGYCLNTSVAPTKDLDAFCTVLLDVSAARANEQTSEHL